eukprot:g31089.t1
MFALFGYSASDSTQAHPAASRVCRRFMPEAGGMMDAAAYAVAAGVLSAGAAAARAVPRRGPARAPALKFLVLQSPVKVNTTFPAHLLPPVLVPFADAEPSTLVDCGSGSTRALSFKDDGKSHVSWEKSAWRGEPLAIALQDDQKLQSLLDLLCKELPPRGQVFQHALGGRFGSRARFMVLSGEEEARAEWEALQHALDYAPDLDRDLFDGMLSGGGMSCQLAWRGRVTPELFSFRNGVLQPGAPTQKASRTCQAKAPPTSSIGLPS